LKLSGKYAITLVALIICLVAAFAAIILFQFRTEISRLNSGSSAALGASVLKEIEEKDIASARVLAAALTNPLYQIDMPKISELIDAVKKQPNVRYVYIYDEHRRIIHDGTKQLALYDKVLDDPLTVKSMRMDRTHTLLENDVLHVATPINLNDDVVGGVRIGYALNRILSDIARQQESLDANYRNAATQQLYSIGIIALTCSLCGLIASVALARSWSKPIIFLAQLTAKIGAGDYNVSIPFDRSDEIGDLASGFRTMLRNLKSLRQKESEQSQALLAANAQLKEANEVLRNEIDERQRAQQEASRQHKRLQIIHEIVAGISSNLDQKLLLETLFAKVESSLPFSAISVCLLDRITGRLVATAEKNLQPELWNTDDEGLGGSPALRLSEMVVEQKAPMVIEDVHRDSRSGLFEPWRRNGWIGYVGLPLMAEGEVLGVLAFYMREFHGLLSEEVEFLATLAGQVAAAILNSHLYGRSLQQADELEKAIHAKDEFLSVMSHELRTPLSVIRGYAQLISTGVTGDGDHEQNEVSEKIISQSDELLRMINEILQVGSLQAGKVQVYKETTDLNDLIRNLKSTFEVLPKKPIVLNWDIPADMPTVMTDGDKLKHILQNLVHNAIKFTEDGSVTVCARCLPESIEFAVMDTGMGIERETLPVIFDMFRQVDSSRTRSHGGVGVGLFIVKKYVDLLEGRIEVESTPGRGTIFTLTIPADCLSGSPKPPRHDNFVRLTA
jgi:signal transduction histidine kinase/HAMP domain-containing protein